MQSQVSPSSRAARRADGQEHAARGGHGVDAERLAREPLDATRGERAVDDVADRAAANSLGDARQRLDLHFGRGGKEPFMESNYCRYSANPDTRSA